MLGGDTVELGVNIDHVATLREARKTVEPEPIYAALLAQEGGADGITVHLREDRRHIKEEDVFLIKKVIKVKLNLEMSLDDGIVDVAMDVCPAQATLVPERRQEVTTEGGLDVVKHFDRVVEVVKRLSGKGVFVSLFVDPDDEQIRASRDCGAYAIELHTGEYANAKRKEEPLEALVRASWFAKSLGLRVHAGHGLTYQNVLPVARIKNIEELNIGHSIVARSVFVGMKQAVVDMKRLIEMARWTLE